MQNILKNLQQKHKLANQHNVVEERYKTKQLDRWKRKRAQYSARGRELSNKSADKNIFISK